MALLGAGCTSGSTSPTTTSGHGSTTTVKGHDTSKGNNKVACAQYVTFHNLGTTPTGAQYRTLIKALRHAQDHALKGAGSEIAVGLTTKKPDKVNTAMVTAGKTCTTLGLG